MRVHLILWPALFLLSLVQGRAQTVKYQTDKHIVNQQERMVFKQWDRKKFTPTKGFLGLNPNYWLTWAWHPSYSKTDLRPLSAAGPQSQRLLLVAAMKNTEEAYKKHVDTLRNTALTEMAGYAGAVSAADPLWQLYYRGEFSPLTDGTDPLQGSTPEIREYLARTGVLDWYREETTALAERLDGARTTDIERGSRIMAYHRLLAEYRSLLSTWEAKKQRAKLYLALSRTNRNVRESAQPIAGQPGRSDIQIADDILGKSKL
ncbi:hypothetical protein [Sphingobacterium cellulitidis]|uniref:hypothetical protein n=1 Tax=Sphingobacterium cellulitidis TaxID=1768011 RepID=UPI000B943D85|nr:hypothetical protein CHT99_01265 [Sphingobacterium cellulitidis]